VTTESWAITETRRLHAQTPEESLLEDLHKAVRDVELLDLDTMKRVGTNGVPYKVTRYDLGREQGKIEGLAIGIATIRAGSGYFNGGIPRDIIAEMKLVVLAELLAEKEARDAEMRRRQAEYEARQASNA
jgi:hypothetical protein